jgi:hypothetical protein
MILSWKFLCEKQKFFLIKVFKFMQLALLKWRPIIEKKQS